MKKSVCLALAVLAASFVFAGCHHSEATGAATTVTEEKSDINAKLPETGAASSISAASNLIVINVRGNIRAGDPVYAVANQPADMAQLRAIITKAVKENPDQKVLIRGDKYATHGNVANAVAACRQAGIKDVNIGYSSQPPVQ